MRCPAGRNATARSHLLHLGVSWIGRIQQLSLTLRVVILMPFGRHKCLGEAHHKDKVRSDILVVIVRNPNPSLRSLQVREGLRLLMLDRRASTLQLRATLRALRDCQELLRKH